MQITIMYMYNIYCERVCKLHLILLCVYFITHCALLLFAPCVTFLGFERESVYVLCIHSMRLCSCMRRLCGSRASERGRRMAIICVRIRVTICVCLSERKTNVYDIHITATCM